MPTHAYALAAGVDVCTHPSREMITSPPQQVDEPALREGLPLKAAKWGSYLAWAVDAFK